VADEDGFERAFRALRGGGVGHGWVSFSARL
jgi:hypothetical protein